MNGREQVAKLSKTYDIIMKGQIEEKKAWDDVVRISKIVSERWRREL